VALPERFVKYRDPAEMVQIEGTVTIFDEKVIFASLDYVSKDLWSSVGPISTWGYVLLGGMSHAVWSPL